MRDSLKILKTLWLDVQKLYKNVDYFQKQPLRCCSVCSSDTSPLSISVFTLLSLNLIICTGMARSPRLGRCNFEKRTSVNIRTKEPDRKREQKKEKANCSTAAQRQSGSLVENFSLPTHGVHTHTQAGMINRIIFIYLQDKQSK